MAKVCTYAYWKWFLTKRGFGEPSRTYIPSWNVPLHRNDASLHNTFLEFRKDVQDAYFAVYINTHDLDQETFPRILMAYTPSDRSGIRIEVTNSDELDNIFKIIDAIADPDLLPFCFGIPWASDLVEELLKNPVPIKEETRLRLSGQGKIIA